ncbi:hypothetical protein pb186bvf_008667 [Paramecium bursaria]
MLPKTQFNPRFHATSRELELLDQVRIINKVGDRTFTICEAPISVHKDLHFGHFYNKICKDIIRKYKMLRGFDVRNQMGLQCFGPSIEHAAFQQLAVQGTKEMEYNQIKIREICTKYVEGQIINYMASFKRWGLLEQSVYLTADRQYQKLVLEQFAQLLQSQRVVHSHKTIIWSVLRQQEIDLDDCVVVERDASAQIVKFELFQDDIEKSTLKNLNAKIYILIPVVDPWMLPGMQGIKLAPQEYIVIQNENLAYVMSMDIYKDHKKYFEHYFTQGFYHSQQLLDIRVHNPVVDNIVLPIIQDEKIEIFAPAHIIDDVYIAKKNNITQLGLVDEDCNLVWNKELKNIMNGDANKYITSLLIKRGGLLDLIAPSKKFYYNHKITGEDLILKSSPGFFVRFDEEEFEIFKEGIQNKIINDDTKGQYIPFLEKMENNHFKWSISNKYVWGIPIPLFKSTKILKRGYYKEKLIEGYLLNKDIVNHFAQLVGQHGSDIYWSWNIVDLLPEKYKVYAEHLEKHTLVFDSNFVSGCAYLDSQSSTLPSTQIRGKDLIFEGQDQNETFLYGSSMISMLNQKVEDCKIFTHRVIYQGQDKLSKDNSFSLSDMIEGTVKFNQTRQHGNGVDILRACVVSLDSDQFNKDLIEFKIQQINFIRKVYWQFLGQIDQRHYPSFNYNELDFVDKYIYHHLVLYILNITQAYEEYDFNRAFQLYYDFLQNYAQPYLDSTKNQLISFYHENLNTIAVYNKIIDFTLTSIHPILCFNTIDIFKVQEWPKIPTSHVGNAKDMITELNLLQQIRASIRQSIDDTQQRIKQKQISKRLEIVFICELGDYEISVLDFAENQLPLFLNCAKVTIETDFQNRKRRNHDTICSDVVRTKFLNYQIKLRYKFYFMLVVYCKIKQYL